jgi:SAM-dependent methyltransferase
MTNLASECYSAIVGGGADTIASFLEWLAQHRGLGSSVRVLDVGCGPGRMFPAFKALGWAVTSVEPQPDFHEAALQAARTAGCKPPECLGFADLTVFSSFDLVTAINDSFSHLLTGEERATALERALLALRPAGALFLEIPNFLWILKNYRSPEPEITAPVPGGEVRLQRSHEIDFHAATFTTVEDYRLIRGGIEQQIEMRHAYAMTTFAELEHQLRAAGFAHVETYNSYTSRSPERLTGGRILLSALRP